MTHLHIVGKRVGIDGKTVILRRDLDAFGLKIHHRLIAAAVPEFEFEGFAAQGLS